MQAGVGVVRWLVGKREGRYREGVEMGEFGEQDRGDGGGEAEGKKGRERGETQEGRKKGLEERDSLAQFGSANIS